MEQVPIGIKDKPMCFLRDYACILLNKLSEVLKFSKGESNIREAIREAELLNYHRNCFQKGLMSNNKKNYRPDLK